MCDKDENLNFVEDSVIYIHGNFDETITKEIIPKFKSLIESQKKLKDGKIIIDICSNGGYLYILTELLSLVEQAKKQNIEIETRSMSRAHSCGAILLMSGTKRYASEFSIVLVHYGIRYMISRTKEQMDRQTNAKNFESNIIRKKIEEYTKIPKKELDKMLEDDFYYIYGDKLIEYKIVDEIV